MQNVDHRLFGDDDLWVAKDPDFNGIGDASFARLKNTPVDSGEQIYHGYVGKALVTFIVRCVISPLLQPRSLGIQIKVLFYRWECVSNKLYKYSLVYEANGVGDTLFEDLRLRLDVDPRMVTFLILYALSSIRHLRARSFSS